MRKNREKEKKYIYIFFFNTGNMRTSVIIILAFATGIVIATSRNYNYSHFIKHAGPRVIRGFKPEYISTAYGFGKRQNIIDIPKINKNERILSILLRYFPQGYIFNYFINLTISNYFCIAIKKYKYN